MPCNIGKVDRIIRAILALVLIMWGINSQYLVMVIIGVSTLFTALSGWCVLYTIMKLDTGCKKQEK